MACTATASPARTPSVRSTSATAWQPSRRAGLWLAPQLMWPFLMSLSTLTRCASSLVRLPAAKGYAFTSAAISKKRKGVKLSWQVPNLYGKFSNQKGTSTCGLHLLLVAAILLLHARLKWHEAYWYFGPRAPRAVLKHT